MVFATEGAAVTVRPNQQRDSVVEDHDRGDEHVERAPVRYSSRNSSEAMSGGLAACFGVASERNPVYVAFMEWQRG
jgi:hypothetical protein